MKKILPIILLTIGINSSAQTVVFEQDFQASGSTNYYINANSPTLGQFNGFNNSLVSNGQVAPIISVVGNRLNFDKTNSQAVPSVYITRSTDFSVVPLVLKLEFDVEVTNITSGSNLAFKFEVGQNFPYTYNTTPTSTNIHSSIGLRLTTTAGVNDNEFFIRRITGGANSTNSYAGVRRLTWVINNSGSDYSYTGPDGQPRLVTNDKHDMWVGSELVFGNSDCAAASPALRNIRITFSSGNANVAIDNMKFTSLLDTPLPVTLTSFTGKVQNRSILLNWTTASEQNNKSFTLSRSHDGKTFEAITVLDGAGNSVMAKNYSYVDQNPYPGVNYYKLQQEDFNGDKQEPVIIPVNSGISGTQLSAFIKTEGLVVNILSPHKTKGTIGLYNIYGQKIYMKQQQVNWGDNQFILPSLKMLGVYVIRYVADGEVISQKIKL